MHQQERNNNSYKRWSVILFQREESWGPPSHKKEVLCGKQKESGDVCKILLTLKLDSSARETGSPSHKKEVLCGTTKRKRARL